MARKTKIILSIDGGGIRGVMPLVYLSELQKELYKIDKNLHWFEVIDMVAGTSTGAIISAALILHDEKRKPVYSPKSLLGLYQNRGQQIFQKDREKIHNESPLKHILDQSFGEIQLSDIDKYFLFLSYNENTKSPFLFTSDEKQYRNIKLSKALLACSSLKEYFPPVEIGTNLLTDGISVAKNTTKIAYEYGRKYFPDDYGLIISLGTGVKDDEIDNVDLDAEKVHEEMVQIADENDQLSYIRFQPKVKRASFDMDDTSTENVNKLYDDAIESLKNDKKNFQFILDIVKERLKVEGI